MSLEQILAPAQPTAYAKSLLVRIVPDYEPIVRSKVCYAKLPMFKD
jgi:hypothetical protein